jgi:hypothetical protein
MKKILTTNFKNHSYTYNIHPHPFSEYVCVCVWGGGGGGGGGVYSFVCLFVEKKFFNSKFGNFFILKKILFISLLLSFT